MRRRWRAAAACGFLLMGTAGGDELTPPRGFPKPLIPANDAFTGKKARLGRLLFYDKRMSVNGNASCGTCHRQELAFTDGRGRAEGATGQLHPRGSMSLVNLAYNGAFNWSDPTVHSLEEQALKPMFSTNPVELGLGAVKGKFLKLIRSDPVYGPAFREAFPGEADPYTIANAAKAIATFERSIFSAGSPYDRFHYDADEGAISEAAKRGEILFFLDTGPACFRCHGGFQFSDAVDYAERERTPIEFHNTGLFNLSGKFSYPAPNFGLYSFTGRAADMGKFRAPTLRNIALTAPYMHDGGMATLGDVLDHYAAGGRTIDSGPLAGAGHKNPGKDRFVRAFRMTARNKADLIAFLESLTDEGLIRNPEYADPWRR